MNLDLTVYERSCARAVRDWAESDRLRDLLRGHGVIVTDTKEGFQEAVFLPKHISAEQYDAKMKADKQANATFDAWLYTMKAKTETA